jgi:hypothetical protein
MRNCLFRNNLRKWNDSDACHRIATCDSGRVTAYPEITPKMEFCPDWRPYGPNQPNALLYCATFGA